MGADASTLVVTNGDSVANLLKEAGKAAEILPWRDVLHAGPVPMTATLEELSAIRAAALETLDLARGPQVRTGFADRDAVVGAHQRFDRIELWFEHDLYDQLQLLQILDYFAGQDVPGGKLTLVQADTYLTDYRPDEILGLEPHARPVTTQELETGAAIWEAFRQTTPEAFAAHLDRPVAPLAHMRPAVLRMLEELPDANSGLSRTERQMLRALAEGADTAGRLFPAATSYDDPKFMGDHPFWRILEDLAFADEPLVSGLKERFDIGWELADMKHYFAMPLALTAVGRDVLAGKTDHAGVNRIDMWLGGTHVTNGNLWRWDPDTESLKSPT